MCIDLIGQNIPLQRNEHQSYGTKMKEVPVLTNSKPEFFKAKAQQNKVRLTRRFFPVETEK